MSRFAADLDSSDSTREQHGFGYKYVGYFVCIIVSVERYHFAPKVTFLFQ